MRAETAWVGRPSRAIRVGGAGLVRKGWRGAKGLVGKDWRWRDWGRRSGQSRGELGSSGGKGKGGVGLARRWGWVRRGETWPVSR